MRLPFLYAAVVMTSAACQAKPAAQSTASTASAEHSDTAFGAMDHRHGDVVGADPSALAHRFVRVPDGGDIILVRKADDNMSVDQIRTHLGTIASSFRRGDFAIPGFVHGKSVSGTDVMSRQSDAIRYSVDTLPDGGALRMRTDDADARRAIHAFIEFQIREHRTSR